MLLKLENIHAGYKGRNILNGLSLDIHSNEIVCIIGQNGAGKSTILKVISGLLDIKTGKIEYNNQNIKNLGLQKRISLGISYFLQGGEVFRNLNVNENLEMGGASLSRNLLRKRIEESFDFFPVLGKNRKKRAGLLSGGEKQMLALAMVILQRPNLLLLDEPSAGLSPGLVNVIMEKILEINQTFESAILLVEQNLNAALEISKRGYIVKNGQVTYEGIPKSIRKILDK